MRSECTVNAVNAPYAVNSDILCEQCKCNECSKNDQKIAFSVYCNDITSSLDLPNIININQYHC